MNIYEETKFLMNKYNISANKDLGQNFLIDENVINAIIDSADIKKEDFVIEIGPGLGTLTSKLVEKAGKVIAVELDKKMINILNDRFALYDNFSLLNEDVLKVNLKELIQEKNRENYSVKIVANLPYYITTPIIMKLLEDKLPIQSITVMVQKEVADRLTAIPGEKDAGAITYCVYYYCEPKKVLLVPNVSFIPAPKVNSEVIRLNVRKEPPVEVNDEKMFFKIIKASFMQRRKTLINSISNAGIASKEEIKLILDNIGVDEAIRGEKLSIDAFAKIANKLVEK